MEVVDDKKGRAGPAQAKWAKAHDWMAVMPIIKKLYKDDRRTLKEVVTIMEGITTFTQRASRPESIPCSFLSCPFFFSSPCLSSLSLSLTHSHKHIPAT